MLSRVHLHVAEAEFPVDATVHRLSLDQSIPAGRTPAFPGGTTVSAGRKHHLVPDGIPGNLHVDNRKAVDGSPVGGLPALLRKEARLRKRNPHCAVVGCSSVNHLRVKFRPVRILVIQLPNHVPFASSVLRACHFRCRFPCRYRSDKKQAYRTPSICLPYIRF